MLFGQPKGRWAGGPVISEAAAKGNGAEVTDGTEGLEGVKNDLIL